jgi:hypothetical protein
MTPPFWQILVVVVGVGVLVWMVSQLQQVPATPEWLRRREEQDRLNAWRTLPRLFRSIALVTWTVGVLAFLWHAALYTHYMQNAPRAADPQSGRIYPSQFKSVTSFLSAEELAGYKRSEYTMIAAWVVGVGVILIANAWSKRRLE